MKRVKAKCILSIALSLALLIGDVPICVNATSSTLEQLNQKKKEKKETEGKIDEASDNVDAMNTQKNSLMGELKNLNSQLSEIGTNLDALEDEVIRKEDEIKKTQADLEEAKQTEEEQYRQMKQRLKFIYERGNAAYLDLLVEAGSFAEFLNKSQYIMRLNQYEQKKLEEYKQTKENIIAIEAKLSEEKIELDDLVEQTKEEQSKVSTMVNKTANNVAVYSNQINETLSAIEAYEAELAKQEQDIAALQEQYKKELELSRLAAQSAWRDISEVTFEENDRYLLANLIYCEAGAEPYAGQLAVGAVVINRVLSSRYPNTVVSVIYQNKQFSPVASGRLAYALANNKATAACYQAADEAMNGVTNVGTCVYFRTPIEGLTGIAIGGHIFY